MDLTFHGFRMPAGGWETDKFNLIGGRLSLISVPPNTRKNHAAGMGFSPRGHGNLAITIVAAGCEGGKEEVVLRELSPDSK